MKAVRSARKCHIFTQALQISSIAILCFAPWKSSLILPLHTRFRKRLSRAVSTVKEKDRLVQDIENSVETGFQIATFRGPLCAEPVEGMAYFVEALHIDQQAVLTETCMLFP